MVTPKMWKRLISTNKSRPTASGSREILAGAPQSVAIPGQGFMRFGINSDLRSQIHRVAAQRGEVVPSRYANIDPQLARMLADEFGVMESNGQSPEARRAYAALSKEISDQYENLRTAGYRHEFYPRDSSGQAVDPYYNNPRWAVDDINQNQRLMTFPTDAGYGSDAAAEALRNNPLLERSRFLTSSGEPMSVNDEFRFVHDVLGHAGPGVGFRAAGEENAFRWHAPTFSPEARRAATSELRGQNSYLNFGPYGEHNRTANPVPYDEIDNPQGTKYADQKFGVMPRWTSEVGRESERSRRFEELARQGKTGLEGAIDPATGNVSMQHWAQSDIDRTDPSRMLTGLDARNKDIRNRMSDPSAVKRTYFGIPADNAPYRPEPGLGDKRHVGSIHGSQLYPIDTDPENVLARATGYSPQERSTNMERLLADQNYSGYFRNHPQLGTVAAVFDPINVQRGAASTPALAATAALGAGAAALQESDGLIGKSMAATGADIGYLGAAIGKLVSNPETYSAAARWAKEKSVRVLANHLESPSASEVGRGALLGVMDTGSMLRNMATVMSPSRLQHLMETGQTLTPWSEPNLDYAPQKVKDSDWRMKRREEALKWLESQGDYDEITRLATGFLSPI